MGDTTVGGIRDAQHVSGTAHLKGLETADVDDLRGPGLGPPEKGREDCRIEDGDFGFDRDILSPIQRGGKGPKAFVRFCKARGDFGFELRLGGEDTAEVFEGGLFVFLVFSLRCVVIRRNVLESGAAKSVVIRHYVLESGATKGNGGFAIGVEGVAAEDFCF
jgi:hypothetical protein